MSIRDFFETLKDTTEEIVIGFPHFIKDVREDY